MSKAKMSDEIPRHLFCKVTIAPLPLPYSSPVSHKTLNYLKLFFCRQYNEMARERPTCRTIEELAADLRTATAGANAAAAAAAAPVGPLSCAAAAAAMNDLPPKYEDLDQPPVYTEEYEAPAPPQQQDGEQQQQVSQSSEETQQLQQQQTDDRSEEGAAALPPPPAVASSSTTAAPSSPSKPERK